MKRSGTKGAKEMFEESEILELKSIVTNSLCKEIIAFANTKGGVIYIGYDDNSKLVGVKNAKEELDRISNMIADTIDPNMIFNISMKIVKEIDKDIIIIKVLKGTNRPYYLKSKGMISEGVYLRLGATNKQATREEIRQMIMEDNGVNFESNISINQNLTFNVLKEEFENKNISINETKMKNMGLINENMQYTNLAYIISDQNPFEIKIAIYKNNEKVEFVDRKEFGNMSVFKQLHEVEDYLILNNKINGRITSMKRIDTPEYDFSVIRESLLNSIQHKNYDFQGAIIINIFKDSIEIVNLGGLVSGLTLEDIRNGSSSTRNPKLASLFHRLDYIEAYGSGIPRILEKYKYQDEQPEIKISPNSFVIKLPKLQNNNEVNEIINFIEQNEKITREDIERIFNCSKSAAIRMINKYVDNKVLSKKSIGKKTYYELY
jgi:ATP-dependent DNA helicase RecG